MSTEYFTLKPPISSLRVEESGPHARISIWEGEALTGTLTILRENLQDWLRMFAAHSPKVRSYGWRIILGYIEEQFDQLERHFHNLAALIANCKPTVNSKEDN